MSNEKTTNPNEPAPVDAIGGATPAKGKPAPAAPWLLSLAQVAEAVGRSYHEVDRWNKRGLMPPPVYLPSGRGTGERKSPSFLADEIRDWLLAGCPHRKAWEEMKKNRAPQPL